MSRRVVIGALALIVLGLAVWLAVDPNAQRIAAQAGEAAAASFASAQASMQSGDLLAPVASAFRDFADSVSGLWSPGTIQIDLPKLDLPR